MLRLPLEDRWAMEPLWLCSALLQCFGEQDVSPRSLFQPPRLNWLRSLKLCSLGKRLLSLSLSSTPRRSSTWSLIAPLLSQSSPQREGIGALATWNFDLPLRDNPCFKENGFCSTSLQRTWLLTWAPRLWVVLAWNISRFSWECHPTKHRRRRMKNRRKKAKKRKAKRRKEKEDEKRLEQSVRMLQVSDAAKILKLITLAAQIAAAKTEDPDEDDAPDDYPIDILLFFYTMLVILITLLIQRFWKVAVRLATLVAQVCNRWRGGSLPGIDESESEEEKEDADKKMKKGRKGREEKPEVTGEQPSSSNQAPPPSSQPADSSSEVSAESAELDIMAELAKIEAEERQIWRDLNAAQPGDPMLGPPGMDQFDAPRPIQDPQPVQAPPVPGPAPMTELHFSIFTTKYGKVYHVTRSCNYLVAPQTGAARESVWCNTCKATALRTRGVPPPGVPVFIRGWGGIAHTDERCPGARSADQFSICTACNPFWGQPELSFSKSYTPFRVCKGGVLISHILGHQLHVS